MSITPALALFPGLVTPLKQGCKSAFGYIMDYVIQRRIIQPDQGSGAIQPINPEGTSYLRHLAIAILSYAAWKFIQDLQRRLGGGNEHPSAAPGEAFQYGEGPQPPNRAGIPADDSRSGRERPPRMATPPKTTPRGTDGQPRAEPGIGGASGNQGITHRPVSFNIIGSKVNQAAIGNSGPVTFNNDHATTGMNDGTEE